MFKILNYFFLVILSLHCGYTSNIHDTLNEINCIPKFSSNFKVPGSKNPIIEDEETRIKLSKEQLESAISYFEEIEKPEYVAVYRSIIDDINLKNSPQFKKTFCNHLELIEKAAHQIKTIVDQEKVEKCVFVGRSPFWMGEFLRTLNPSQENQYISLACSGCPGISLSAIQDYENDYSNFINEKGFKHYSQYFCSTVGLVDKLLIVDHIGSGRALNSFVKIINAIYSYNDKKHLEIKYIDLALNTESSRPKIWQYDSSIKQIKFVQSLDNIRKGIKPFTVNTIHLKILPSFLCLLDYGDFENSSCNIPQYPAKDWEKSPEQVMRDNNYGKDYPLYLSLMKKYIDDKSLK